MTLTPGSYSFVATRSAAFDMTLGCSVKRLVFVLLYNGVPIGDHASRELADRTADAMANRLKTSRECFEVREEWR